MRRRTGWTPNRAGERLRLSRHINQGSLDACWPWTGARSPLGYGRTHVYIDGQRKSRNAHQAVWLVERGPIPPGQCVLHRCDNRACCNPAHLFLGTQAENTADRHAKGRDARGARNTKTKLSPEQVAEIRQLHASGRSAASIARDFGVWSTSIDRIVRGKNHRILASGGAK